MKLKFVFIFFRVRAIAYIQNVMFRFLNSKRGEARLSTVIVVSISQGHNVSERIIEFGLKSEFFCSVSLRNVFFIFFFFVPNWPPIMSS